MSNSNYSSVQPLTEDPIRSFAEPQEILSDGSDYRALITTNRGTILIDLFQDKAPITVNN
ncbi:MAG: peptidylprolyl isomerase, partial [Trueperaceae bacterium]|nr:peptidylprolyl isomerase [Trueperaceae bacterium]